MAFFALSNLINAQCTSTPDYSENYSSTSGWTTVDRTNHPTNVTISGGVASYSNVKGGREQRIYKQLPFTLNNKAFVSECKMKITGGNSPYHLLMSFTEGISDTWHSQTGQLAECNVFSGTVTNQDALLCHVAQTSGYPNPITDGCCPQSSGNWKIFVGYKDGTSMTNTANSGINVPNLNTNYYVRMQRTDYGSGVISVFSDAAMTIHVAGSPQCFSITPGSAIADLKYVQHGVVATGYCKRTLSMEIDDLKLYNGESPCPLQLTPSFTTNSIVCSGTSVSVNGSASTSGTSIPINDHVWLVQESDVNGNAISTAPTWWSPFFAGSPGVYTIPSFATGGPDMICGKYYKISLALQNCGNIWATTSRVVYIGCPPSFKLKGSTSKICSGDAALLIATMNAGSTSTYNVNWTPISPAGPTIYNGPLASVSVSPTVPTTYLCTVTDIPTGCISTATWYVNVINADPSFSLSVNTAPASFFTLSALANDQTANLQPGFGYTWFLEELDASNNVVFSFPNPFCWFYPLSTPNPFNGIDCVANTYSGSCTIANCTSPPVGQFLYNHTYRITRGVWNDQCAYRQFSVIITTVKSGNGHTVEVVEDPNAPDYSAASMASLINQKVLENAIAIYPNPSNGLYTVELSNETTASIEVYNVLGKLVQSIPQADSKTMIDLTGFPKGVYLVNIFSNGEQTSKKIILE